MQREKQIRQLRVQPLDMTYQEYEQRGRSIQNQCIGKYVVYGMIGKGSYGSVFKGMDDQTKRQVAVKLIDMKKIRNEPNQVVKAIQLRLAESQPRLMYMCNSPYLLKCYDVFENEDLKVMMIEYCNGGTLQAEIQRKTRIPENQAWIILKHIINGLMELHSFKIVHRDLKAENIMSHNGTYKIIDFGFSKKLQISQENAEVRNTSLGTITTMAPEVMGRKPYGLKADIWSLGIIFFQMIYGVYPYDSLTAGQMYRQIQSKKLFNREEPFTFNGFTPSKDAFRFLKFTIVVETDQRPDWKALSQFPNIKNANNDDLSQRFLNKCDVVYDRVLDCNVEINQQSKIQKIEKKVEIPVKEPKKQEKPKEIQPQYKATKPIDKQELHDRWNDVVEQYKIVQNAKKEPEPTVQPVKYQKKEVKVQPRKNIFNLEQSMKAERQQEQRKNMLKKKEEQIKPIPKVQIPPKVSVPTTKRLNPEEIKLKEREINQQQREQYEWVQNAHLQCLKTEFVFRQIFNPLDVSQALKKDNRASIEFFYLLAARCFNNMSPIQDKIEERTQKGKNTDQVVNLSEQVDSLYKKVKTRFIELSTQLTENENKYKSMIGDWFAKRWQKQNFEEKDRFLTGIENYEYTKDQQIDYTFKYYTQRIKSTLSGTSNIHASITRLEKYQKLMKVKLSTLRQYKKNYEEFKQMVINGQK